MDFNTLMWAFLFGTIGMGLFVYGRKSQRMVPLGAGVGLMVVPYFIANVVAMVTVCCALIALPWVFRNR